MGLVTRLRDFMRGGGSIVLGTAVMNVCTFGFTVIAAALLDTSSYGALFALLNLIMVISVVQMGLQATAARRIVSDPGAVAQIERAILRVTYRTSLAIGLALAVASPLVVWMADLDSVWPALLLAALAVPTTIMGGQFGILQGEKRWTGLSWMYVLAGVPRLVGLGLVVWRPDETAALAGSGLGVVAPVLLGWWLLRHPRGADDSPAPHGAWELLRESVHNSQALLAFFALANVDIFVARHALGGHDSGLYAVGLIIAKMILFLPQFVIIVMFPSLATARQRRRAVVTGTATILALGSVATVAVALLAGVAADLGHSPKLVELRDELWLFAVLGTLLSVTQLMVYAVLARRGRRSVYLVWLALAVVVVAGSRTHSMEQLLGVMVGVLAALAATLLVVSLRADPRDAPAQ